MIISHMSINVRLYQEGDEEGIVNVINSAFGSFRGWGLDAEKWLEYDKDDFAFNKNLALVAETDGKIVGHVMLMLREFKLGKNTYIKFGGVANVSTMPEYRGRGIATRLMTKAIEVCKEKDLSLSSLLTGYDGIAHGIYRKVGYTDTLFESSFRGKRKEMEEAYQNLPENNSIQIREAEISDLETFSSLYDRSLIAYNGVCRRPLEYWKKKIFDKKYYHSFFYVTKGIYKIIAFKNGTPTGYAIYGISEEADRRIGFPPFSGGILELVGLDNESRIALFKHILNEFLSKKLKFMVFSFPDSKDYKRLTRFFKKIGSSGILMDYVTKQDKLFTELKNELSLRLEEYGGFNRLRFTLISEYGETNLEVSGNEVDIIENNSDNKIMVDKDYFVRMIYGIESFNDVLLKNGIISIKTEKFRKVYELLNVMFPRREFHIWTIDHW